MKNHQVCQSACELKNVVVVYGTPFVGDADTYELRNYYLLITTYQNLKHEWAFHAFCETWIHASSWPCSMNSQTPAGRIKGWVQRPLGAGRLWNNFFLYIYLCFLIPLHFFTSKCWIPQNSVLCLVSPLSSSSLFLGDFRALNIVGEGCNVAQQ